MSDSPHLVVERDGHVVTLTMNRPEARNAFGAEMLVRLADAWDLVDGDDGIRVAILTGTDFFPRTIASAFSHGLVIVFTAAAAMALVAAFASFFRGGTPSRQIELPGEVGATTLEPSAGELV